MTKIEQAYREGYEDTFIEYRKDDAPIDINHGWQESQAIEKQPVWSQSPPTKEGWYWMLLGTWEDQRPIPIEIRIEDGLPFAWVVDCVYTPKETESAWWQPIEEPEPPEGM